MQSVGPDHAGVPDVDDTRVADVHPDPKSDERDQTDREPAHRDEQAQRLTRSPAPEREQQHPHEPVDQERIGERHRQPEVGLVEERQRDREAEQHHEVKLQQRRAAAAQAQERKDEQHTHRHPEPRMVELVAERARSPSSHRPGDLEPGPGLGRRAGDVVDDHLGDLVPARGEPAHLPPSRAARVLRRRRCPVMAEDRRDLRDAGGDPLRLGGGQLKSERPGVRRCDRHRRVRVRCGRLRAGTGRARHEHRGNGHECGYGKCAPSSHGRQDGTAGPVTTCDPVV